MDFKKIRKQAEQAVEKRGGTASLKGDLAEIKAIAKSKGSTSEKAKAAANALKNPGRAGNKNGTVNTRSGHR